MPSDARPVLLFYCQHSLGIGHLTRSFALAVALEREFRVVLLNGGPLPPGIAVPHGFERIDLPPLGMDEGHALVSRGLSTDVASVQARRRALIESAVDTHRPAVLLVELFPFGRKKFAGEILSLIRAVRRRAGRGAVIACSLRDILVNARRDQQRHDDRARWLADRYFDVVLAHTDPRFARLEESFRPRRAMRVRLEYTGFVVPERAAHSQKRRGAHLLVSAGGGSVGGALFRAVLDARARHAPSLPLRAIAGPFLPEADWAALQASARGMSDVVLVRQVPDLVEEMRAARASISQCGYNAALDIVVSGVPALVVPYETEFENEQPVRAQRLAAANVIQYLPASQLDPDRLGVAIPSLLAFSPAPPVLALDGAANSAAVLRDLHERSRRTPSPEELRCVPV